ncbi:MAG TPA: DUF5995 family protein [Ornithinibacter sp.]|nr:DUF5995 family protein [Ornithinibacter sp.]
MDGAGTAEERLAALAQEWGDASDRRAVFAECYLVMTRRMEENIRAGRFHDGVWVGRLLDRFATYYFDAVDSYGGLIEEPVCPAIWHEALEACADPDCHPLQALMLGINAHINHDLALALVDVLDDWPTLDDATRQRRREDHEMVNTIIDDTTDEVQRDVVGRWSPAAEALDWLMGPLDEWAFGALAQSWRSRVWADAMDLVVLDPTQRAAARVVIGERASGVATVILLGRHEA